MSRPVSDIVEVHDPSDWNAVVLAHSYASFQQSWEWGTFQESQGCRVKRYRWTSSDQTGKPLRWQGQFIRQDRFGTGYWFVPRGPISLSGSPVDLFPAAGDFQGKLRGVLPGHTLFFRVEPPIHPFSGRQELDGWKRTRAMSPACTRIIDLSLSEEDLLAQMHPKTRYHIRLAERHGVQVREGNTEDDMETFLQLMRETAERDGFLARREEYLRQTFLILRENGFCRLRIAECDGKPLAANMEIWFGDMVTYLHGASANIMREKKAPFLLQWEAMRSAKKAGYRWYDLWGCNPVDQKSPAHRSSLEGVSRFKAGWGGAIVEYIGTFDAPIHPTLYRLLIR